MSAVEKLPAEITRTKNGREVLHDLLRGVDLAKQIEAETTPRRRMWLVVFEDASVPPVTFTEEASARHYYEERSINWNCHLFASVNSNCKEMA